MSGDTVTIACSLPHGIRLTPDVVIEGTASLRRDDLAWPMPRGTIAVTRVPAAVWREWHALHRDQPIVKNCCVYEIVEEPSPPEAA